MPLASFSSPCPSFPLAIIEWERMSVGGRVLDWKPYGRKSHCAWFPMFTFTQPASVQTRRCPRPCCLFSPCHLSLLNGLYASRISKAKGRFKRHMMCIGVVATDNQGCLMNGTQQYEGLSEILETNKTWLMWEDWHMTWTRVGGSCGIWHPMPGNNILLHIFSAVYHIFAVGGLGIEEISNSLASVF